MWENNTHNNNHKRQESVCIKYRVSLSIYTIFWLENYLLALNSLWEFNNPSAPQFAGTFPPDKQGRLNSMTLNDLITLMNLQIGTSRTNEIQYMKYTSEYTPKLQIHQHAYYAIILPMALLYVTPSATKFSLLGLDYFSLGLSIPDHLEALI